MVNLWQIQFADFACEDVIRAVPRIDWPTRTEGFPPTIGAVKEQAAKLHSKKQPLRRQRPGLWSAELPATAFTAAGKEYDKLPLPVQKAVGDAEQLRTSAAMDEETVASVVASNFARSYRTVLAREKEALLLRRRSEIVCV